MNEVLTVPTAFGDISDMAQGLVDRVDEQQIILYGPNAYEEGSELGFALLLLDGTTALEGRGVVAASVDGGEERDPATRFDIVLHGLHFDGAAEVVFERMVMTRLSMVGEAPPSDITELAGDEEPAAVEPAEAEPVEDPALDEMPSFAAEGFEEEATVVAQIEDHQVQAAFDAADPEPEPEPEPAYAADPEPEPEPEAAYAADPEPEPEPAYAADPEPSAPEELQAGRIHDEDALTEPPLGDAGDGFESASGDDAAEASEDAGDDDGPRPSYADDDSYGASSSDAARPSQAPPRTFSIPPRAESLYPTAADLEVQPGAPPPEPPAPPSGFAIDNSLSGGLVRPHTVWSPVAPPPPEPRPSSGLFQYAAGPIPIPDHPPRPDLDPSLRVQRAPAPMREGEAPPAELVTSARSARRPAEFDDALMADAVELDPITADE